MFRCSSPASAPQDLPASVSSDMRRLYDLIWRRALACQMANARIQQVSHPLGRLLAACGFHSSPCAVLLWVVYG